VHDSSRVERENVMKKLAALHALAPWYKVASR
jgi:hypothetical protein